MVTSRRRSFSWCAAAYFCLLVPSAAKGLVLEGGEGALQRLERRVGGWLFGLAQLLNDAEAAVQGHGDGEGFFHELGFGEGWLRAGGVGAVLEVQGVQFGELVEGFEAEGEGAGIGAGIAGGFVGGQQAIFELFTQGGEVFVPLRGACREVAPHVLVMGVDGVRGEDERTRGLLLAEALPDVQVPNQMFVCNAGVPGLGEPGLQGLWQGGWAGGVERIGGVCGASGDGGGHTDFGSCG